MSSAIEKKASGIDRLADILATLVAVGMVVYQLLVASPLLLLTSSIQSGIHWGFIGVYFLLVKPLRFKGGRILDLAMIVLTVMAVVSLIQMRSNLQAVGGLYTDFQKFISIAQIIIALIIGWRAMGSVLPIVCIVCFAYGLYGSYIPGMFNAARMTLMRLSTYLMVGNEGLFGMALNTSAQFIFLFVLFGSVLAFIGAGEFFVDIAFSLFGKVRGGPAQAAIYSSMLMGMVNGSGAANVVTTGTFTIPLMKKTGFDKNTAGAVEAVASNGGQIMPPVMGAVAFLMADATSIPYIQITMAALVPAILYYLTLSVSVFTYSHKHRIPISTGDPEKTPGRILKKGWFYFVPLIMLVALMVMGISAQRAALYTILVTFVIGLIVDHKRFTLRNLAKVCTDTVNGMIGVAVACMLAGIITGVINITGLGLKISGLITVVSGSSLLLLALLTAVICIILGMGLPTSACYIVLAILVAPAMTGLGVPVIAAHMFILYFGTIASLTPPVALAVFAACGISGGDMWKTGLQAMKFAAAGFLVPFIFVADDTLLLVGTVPHIAFAILTALFGCAVLALALGRWCFRDLHWMESVLLLPCAIFLIMPHPLWLNAIGAVGAAVILLNAWHSSKKGKFAVDSKSVSGGTEDKKAPLPASADNS